MITLINTETKYISFYDNDYTIAYPLEKISEEDENISANITLISKFLNSGKGYLLENNLSKYKKYYVYAYNIEDFPDFPEGLYEYQIKLSGESRVIDSGLLNHIFNNDEKTVETRQEHQKTIFKK
jgi:hypothetical protein